MKILIVDDDSELAAEVVKVLTDRGYEAEHVDNAKEAIPLAETGDYDFVLVDYRMPEFDGTWFMKNVELPQHTKALLITFYTDRRLIAHMFSLGVSGYLIKPFDGEELVKHLAFHSGTGTCDV